jgi:hypothetical protein
MAKRANRLTGFKSPEILDTLAAAHAEAAEFDAAVESQQKAIDMLAEADEAVKKDFASRLELYRSHKPYRMPASDTGPTDSSPQ